jgi:hypothetical protein
LLLHDNFEVLNISGTVVIENKKEKYEKIKTRRYEIRAGSKAGLQKQAC